MTLVVLSILALACSCVVVAGFNFKLPSTRTSVRRRHDILAIAERMEGFKGGAQTSGASDFKSPDEPSKVKPKGLFNTRFMEYFFRSLLGMVIVDYDVLRIVSKFCAAIFWLFAGLSIAGSVGFDTKPFLGLFSISLVGLGYGAKDILSSTFAGIFVLFARPFKRGDVIKTKIGGQEFYGKVVSVDIRYLKIQNYDKDGGVQILPLASIYNAPITVLSSE